MDKYPLGTLYRRKEIQVVPLKLDCFTSALYQLFYTLSSTSQLSILLFVILLMYLLGTKGWSGYSEGHSDMWYIVPCWLIMEYGKVLRYFGYWKGRKLKISWSFLKFVRESSESKRDNIFVRQIILSNILSNIMLNILDNISNYIFQESWGLDHF